MNLYWNVVPAGMLTDTVHVGYDAEERAICGEAHHVICQLAAQKAYMHMLLTAFAVFQVPS